MHLVNSLVRSKRLRSVEFVGGLVLAAIVLVTLYPGLSVGFWGDDYNFLDTAVRSSWQGYLSHFFDPRLQTTWYRPVQGIQWWIEYALFHGDPFGYHVVQNLYHLLNVLLLYRLVTVVSTNSRIGFVAALLYAAWPLHQLVVLVVDTPDPLLSCLFLATVSLWVEYLRRGGRVWFILTFVAFVTTLLTKEPAVTLPMVLLLVDRWLVRQPTPWRVWAKRNAVFFLFVPIYLLLDSTPILRRLEFNGANSVLNAAIPIFTQHLLTLSFPWGDTTGEYIFLALFTAILLYSAHRRIYPILFLGAFVLLTVLPVLSFSGAGSRFLYIPSIASAVGLSVLLEFVLQMTRRLGSNSRIGTFSRVAVGLALLFGVFSNIATIYAGGENIADLARQRRIQFRPILQRYPTFAPDTLLYFAYPQMQTYNLSGLLALRYGQNVVVSGTDYPHVANLRSYNAAYAFYYDDQGTLILDQQVEKENPIQAAPPLPIHFENAIVLDGFESVRATNKQNDGILLILYWQAIGPIDKDYTVFAHLVDRDGKTVAGYDSQPLRGNPPTSTWKPGTLFVDAILLPIGPDAPIGDGYRVELGLYDLATMQRLSILDGASQPAGDSVVFEPFSIAP